MSYQYLYANAMQPTNRGVGSSNLSGHAKICFGSSYLVDSGSAYEASKPRCCGTFASERFPGIRIGRYVDCERFQWSKTIVSIGHVVTDRVSYDCVRRTEDINRAQQRCTNPRASSNGI